MISMCVLLLFCVKVMSVNLVMISAPCIFHLALLVFYISGMSIEYDHQVTVVAEKWHRKFERDEGLLSSPVSLGVGSYKSFFLF